MAARDDNKPERISEAEHAVMEVLWAKSPLTAADVCDAVGTARGWSLATVKTLIGRLVQKQAIAAAPDGRRYLYSPLIKRADYIGGESKRLVDRLFGGKAASLVAHLAVHSFGPENVSVICMPATTSNPIFPPGR